MTYSERLSIPWWWLVIGALFVASVGVAVFAYVELWMAVTIIALTLVGVALGLLAYSGTRLTLDENVFTAGRYRLEREYIASATAFEGDAARQAQGPGADRSEFLFTRPFINGLVRIDLADPADPHSAWLVSTRNPGELAAALNGGSR